MKCSICGYELRPTVVARNCRYDRATGAFNVGKRTHVDCAMAHWDAHWNRKNDRSLVVLADSATPRKDPRV